jgi:sulfide:quinone oxidoreductase
MSSTPKRIVILGAGTGGTLIANKLRRELGDSARITILDLDGRHVYQPDLLFVPFGLVELNTLCRPRAKQIHKGVDFRIAEVESVEAGASTVHLADGSTLPYDLLVVATGASLQPEETEGMTGPGWNEKVFTYYNVEGAQALHGALERFRRGRLVVNFVDLPIKCPVAPLEFCFLADWWLRKRGLRQEVEITFATPLDGAFTQPVAAEALAGILKQKEIAIESEFATGRVDGEAGKLISWDEREIPFDLLVEIPLHGGAPYVGRSPGLGDDLGFVAVDEATLQAKVAPNVFALGDATNVPTSKAGSVAHFQAETVVENIHRFLAGKELESSFDGHANCFIETGYSKALLIDFNYEVEPLPGRFPLPLVGPLPLLRQSRLNHLGKLVFRWIYWHVLIPGRHLPLIPAQMKMAGKKASAARPKGGTR